MSDWRFAKDGFRKRLVAAQARKASAAKNLDEATDEVEAAEALMEEAEERWPEITIDDEESTASPLKKRRKVLASSSSEGHRRHRCNHRGYRLRCNCRPIKS